MEVSYVLPRIIFETVVGSRAYGINREDSDWDRAGVMIPGEEYFYGLDKFEQFSGFPEKDRVIYDIRKIVKLIADNNPNCMDLLWSPDRCILQTSLFWERFRENRDLFLSRRCRHTFSGYAMAQFTRILTHRRFLLNPLTEKPTREKFGLKPTSIFPTAQLKAIVYSALGDFFIEEEKENFLSELDDIYGDYIIPLFGRYIKPDRRVSAMEYLQVGIKSQANTLTSLGPSYIKDEYLEEAQKELAFYHADKEWAQFEAWKKNRNKARAELEIKFGYDCYSDDTEFLTQEGWKTYGAISSKDKLATLKIDKGLDYRLCSTGDIKIGKKNQYLKNFGIEYQHYLDRFEGIYSGTMYNFIGNHMNIFVTPNHRMLFRPVEKNNRQTGEFRLEEAALLPNCFDFIKTVTPITKTYEYPDQLKDLPIKIPQFLSLMGWYLSDGSMEKRKGKSKNVRISQKEKGRLHRHMSRFHSCVKDKICSLYTYDREPNEFRPYPIREVILCVTNKIIRDRIYECGDVKNKRIPRWVFSLSKVLKETLLKAMLLGDGTVRDTSIKSWIYYTTLKNLADDVQELALTCGWETSLYGPYKQEKGIMYQVHLNKNVVQYDRCKRSINLKKIEVENQKIVCFTVPNRTLITRRKGHVAFHGNSKHAGHLCRLYRVGKEILETGKVNVDRTGIDADELKAIRNGAWTFEQIEEYSKKMDEELTVLYKTSALQKYPQFDKINELLIETCKEYLNGQK